MGGKPRRAPRGPFGLPLVVQVHQQAWTIDYVECPSPEEALMGVTDARLRNIRVDRGLARDALKDTTLHEILHAYFEHSDLNYTIPEEEAIVRWATRAIIDMTRANGVFWR